MNHRRGGARLSIVHRRLRNRLLVVVVVGVDGVVVVVFGG